MIEVNKIDNLTNNGNIVKIHFEGYNIIKETVIENGQEITYEKGVEQNPQFVQDTYTWKSSQGFKQLRLINNGKNGKEYYYVEDTNTDSAIIRSKNTEGTLETGIYLKDGYQASLDSYITELIDNTYSLVSDLKYLEDKGLYLIEIQNSNGYIYNVYFDSYLMIKEISQEYRYGQNTLIYTIELIENTPELPDWANENGDIVCTIKQNDSRKEPKNDIEFRTHQEYKNYIYTGDKYKILSDTPVMTLGAYQNIVTNNTDFHVQQNTMFYIQKGIE